MEVGLNQDLNNNTTYKVYFKNDDRMVLERYQVMPFIRMYFDRFIKNNELNIINYFLQYDEDINQHILYFDTLDNTDHISLKQIVDYIIYNANQNSNIDLRFMKAYTNEKSAEDLRENEESFIDNLFNETGLDRLEKILYVSTALYLLSIIKDISDN